ncbi:hypothetical protein [Sphingobium cupriresistens]|uniref:Uncharacterized protein n=1 Tax=Sphingobium cupriresistens TaxID=1132417 RepID=A0A8G1ZI95_9SPHN|nr:hypothetical protein [Sphingobium cupriresistens]RYM11767.1 hypothetical protein EWH12_08775 [Sphingobium cupriresistens]
MSQRFEYIAAAILDSACGLSNGLSCPRQDIQVFLFENWNIEVSDDEISNAIRLLNMCDLSYIEDDEFAGAFITIGRKRFEKFIDRVEDDRRRYDNIVSSAPDENIGINRAESGTYRYLELYNKYAVLRKYHAFGSDWLRQALSNLRESSINERSDDLVVKIQADSQEIAEIRDRASELRRRIRTGNELGEITPEQASALSIEIGQLEQALSGEYVRSAELASRSKKTLGWVSEKAAGTFVGEAAKLLLKLILSFLGMQS